MLVFTQVSLSYDDKIIFSIPSLTFSSGSIVLLVGPSGKGKTSLLRSLLQLEQSYTGSIAWNKQELKILSDQQRALLISALDQRYTLFARLTVLENCLQPLMKVHGKTRQEALDRVVPLLERVGMDSFINAYPKTLSGGQKQRIALVRALASNCPIVCLDEPTSALDPLNTACVVELLQERAAQGTLIILASQDTSFIRSVAPMAYLVNDQKVSGPYSVNNGQSPIPFTLYNLINQE